MKKDEDPCLNCPMSMVDGACLKCEYFLLLTEIPPKKNSEESKSS